VAAVTEALRRVDIFDESHVESAVRGTAAERSLKAGQLIHAIRVALTGRTTSPGLFEVIALLGRARTVARLDRLVAFLHARGSSTSS
jgi:glutamyl-tRNA synthetase